MRRFLLANAALAMGIAGPAMAADMRPPAYKVPPPVSVYSWTGCYIGIAGGGAWGRSNHVSGGPGGPGLDLSAGYGLSGGLVGGTIGCNYQSGWWVVGAEGDLSWIDKKGSANEIPPFNTTSVVGTKEHWLGTERLRFGFTPTDRVLLYVTGGVAAARVEATIDATVHLSDTRNRWGWTAGAGWEAALWDNCTAKLEYLYVKFSSQQYFTPSPAIGTNTRSNVPLDDHIVRVGLNYRFGAAPVVAGY
jgi:outer membrane immunogenic protein